MSISGGGRVVAQEWDYFTMVVKGEFRSGGGLNYTIYGLPMGVEKTDVRIGYSLSKAMSILGDTQWELVSAACTSDNEQTLWFKKPL